MTDAPAQPQPETELEKMQKQNQEYLDGWKRAKADYLNLKRDSEKEKMEIVQFANAGLLIELFPIYDNLKTALKHIPEGQQKEAWAQGFQHILRQFKDFLSTLKVEEIATEGKQFDPLLHEAVGKEKREGIPSGQILDEQQSGFTLQGKVIRHAKVIVSE